MVKSYSNHVQGGWLKPQAQASLPRTSHDFARARDPLYARQLSDLEKTEAQRRGEQSGDGKSPAKNKRARKTDKPVPALRPPPHMRGTPSNGKWLAAQQAQVMANVPEQARPQTAPQRSVNQNPRPNKPTQSPQI